jgi:hypothetical protein
MACVKYIFIAAACTIVVALPGTAFAQQLMPGLSLHPDKPPLTPEEQDQKPSMTHINQQLRNSPTRKTCGRSLGNYSLDSDNWAAVVESALPNLPLRSLPVFFALR